MIEYQHEYANNAHDVTLTLFQCPSRSQRNALPPIEDRFGAYESGGHRFAKTDYCANNNACPNRPDFTSLKAFADGVSNTALIGEKAFDPTVQTETSWYWDEPIWLGGSKGTARAGEKIVPDGVGIEFRERWGAPHASSAHFCFADGSVHLLASMIDQQILAALMTLNGQDDNPRIASEQSSPDQAMRNLLGSIASAILIIVLGPMQMIVVVFALRILLYEARRARIGIRARHRRTTESTACK